MGELIGFVEQHQFVVGVAATWLLSSAVRALPAPAENGSAFYRWFYTFTHLVLANWELAAKGRAGQR